MSFWQLRIAFPSLSAGAGFDVANVWRHEIGTEKRYDSIWSDPARDCWERWNLERRVTSDRDV